MKLCTEGWGGGSPKNYFRRQGEERGVRQKVILNDEGRRGHQWKNYIITILHSKNTVIWGVKLIKSPPSR